MRAILLVDHGSVREAANQTLDAIGRLVADAAPDLHVEIAHMELASPSIADGVAACAKAGATEVVVCPYMLAPGRHSTDDIPRLAREAADRHPGLRLFMAPPLGVDERLAEVVLTRARDAAAENQESEKS